MTVGQEFVAVELEDVKLAERVLGERTTSRGLKASEGERRLMIAVSAIWNANMMARIFLTKW